MIDQNNGQVLSLPVHPKPKRHNAKLCPFVIRERIVNALANGDSKRAIARALRVSNNTVTAVAEQDWQRVAARKAKLAARYEKLADLYTERQIDELESGAKIPLNLCQSGGGIATDKAMVLRGDPFLTIQHKVDLQDQSSELEAIRRLYDLIASQVARMKPLLDDLPPPPELPEPSELKWYNRHSPVQEAGIYGLNVFCKMGGAAGQILKAKAAKALLPADRSQREENAEQKDSGT
jgi:hypothetical protein